MTVKKGNQWTQDKVSVGLEQTVTSTNYGMGQSDAWLASIIVVANSYSTSYHNMS